MKSIVLILLILSLQSTLFSEGQDIRYNGPFISIGASYTFHFGRKTYHSIGPDFSYGYGFDDYLIHAINLGIEKQIGKSGIDGYVKYQGGSMLIGGSIGPYFTLLNGGFTYGIQTDVYAGFGYFAMFSIRYMSNGVFTSASQKIRMPIPLE